MATKPLDPEEKARRAMSLGEIADRIGGSKATQADAKGEEEKLKLEMIRRNALEATGKLFHVILTPPSESIRFDPEAVKAQYKEEYWQTHYTKVVQVGWVMRCNARSDAAAAQVHETQRAAA